jgi:hypothetical protein
LFYILSEERDRERERGGWVCCGNIGEIFSGMSGKKQQLLIQSAAAEKRPDSWSVNTKENLDYPRRKGDLSSS